MLSAFWSTPVLPSVLPAVAASRHVTTNADEIARVAGWLAYEPYAMPHACSRSTSGTTPTSSPTTRCS